MDAVHPAQFEADTDRQRAGLATRQGAIEIATAVTEPVAGGIAGDQRQEQHVRRGHGWRGGNRDAVWIGLHRRIRPPGAEFHRCIRLHHRGHGGLPAGSEQPTDQWPAVDLGADRPAEGDGACRARGQELPEVIQNESARLPMRVGVEGLAGRDFFAAQGSPPDSKIGSVVNADNSGGFCGLIAHGVLEGLC